MSLKQDQIQENILIERLTECLSLSDAVKTVLQMYSDSIKEAVDQGMIPESAGRINITINRFFDDCYKVTISGNGVGLIESEAEDLLSKIDDHDKWPIAMFKLAGHQSGYKLYSNHRKHEDMFGYICHPNGIEPINRESIEDNSSDNIDILGSKMLFTITSGDMRSVSDLGSAFRNQAQNIETPVVYELQKNNNTTEKMYFNF